MIILSGVLVVLAIALLVTGIVMGNTGNEVLGLDGLKLIYVSIGVSIVSALFLAVGVFLRRKELFGTAASPATAAPARGSAAKASRTVAKPARAKARVGATDDTMPVSSSPGAPDVPAETLVYVVPGRKRYHLDSCRQLAGREREELTFEEARGEGFTPCTACLPDTALAARAAVVDSEPPVAEDVLERTTVEPELPEAEVTRTDLPVTSPRRESEVRESEGREPEVREDDETERTIVDRGSDSVFETVRRTRSLFEPLERAEPVGKTEPELEPVEDAAKPVEPAVGESRDRVVAGGPLDEEELVDAAAAVDDADHDGVKTAEPTGPAGDFEAEVAEESAPSDGDEDETEGQEESAGAAARMAESEVEPSSEPEPEPETQRGHESETGSQTEAVPVPEPDPVPEPEAGPEAAPETEVGPETEPEADPETGPGTEPSAESDAGDVAASQSEAAVAQEPPAVGDAEDAPAEVRILSGTKRYHRSDCALIAEDAEDAEDLETLSHAEAKERGCTPCLVCQPDRN